MEFVLIDCLSPSTEIQGRLVGTMQCSLWKFTARTGRTRVQIPCFWLATKKFCGWSAKWSNRETGKVSQGKFQNKTLMKQGKLQALAQLQATNTPINVYFSSLEGIKNFYCWYAMYDFYFLHLCTLTSVVHNAHLTFYISMFVTRRLKLSSKNFPLWTRYATMAIDEENYAM